MDTETAIESAVPVGDPAQSTSSAFDGLPDFSSIPTGNLGAVATPFAQPASAFPSAPAATFPPSSASAAPVAAPPQRIDRRLQGDVQDTAGVMRDAETKFGPWRHGRYVVVEGSAPLPSRCVSCNGAGDVQRRERYRIYPLYLKMFINFLTTLFGLFGGIFGIRLVNLVAGKDAYDEEVVRFSMSTTRHRIYQVAKYACYALATMGVFMVVSALVMAVLQVLNDSEVSSAMEKAGIGKDGKLVDEDASSPWGGIVGLFLFGFLAMFVSGIGSLFSRPLWANRIEASTHRVWLSGVNRSFRELLPPLPTKKRPPLPIWVQEILATIPGVVIVTSIVLIIVIRVSLIAADVASVTMNPAERFELPARMSGFAAPSNTKQHGKLDRYVIELGIDHPTVGHADRLVILVPKEPSQQKLPCAFVAMPSRVPVVGSDLDEFPDPLARRLSGMGWITVTYQTDGATDTLQDERLLHLSITEYARSRAGMVNAQNAISYALEHFPVDPDRLISAGVGHSGSTAMLLAAHDERIDGCFAAESRVDHVAWSSEYWQQLSPISNALLTKASPITHADHIRVPLLLFHRRQRDGFEESAEMEHLVRSTNPQVELIAPEGDTAAAKDLPAIANELHSRFGVSDGS